MATDHKTVSEFVSDIHPAALGHAGGSLGQLASTFDSAKEHPAAFRPSEPDLKNALVTGGNRGIGLAIARGLLKLKQFRVIITSTDVDKGLAAVATLKSEGFDNVDFHQLNVENDDSIQSCITDVLAKYKVIHVLVNNAGIGMNMGQLAYQTELAALEKQFRVNTLGPVKLCNGLVPRMIENKYGRIVNVSSGAGQLSEMNGGHLGYRMSKSALNALTRALSWDTRNHNILVNSLCPGFVATDMTSWASPEVRARAITPEQGADTAIWLAALPAEGPRGGFFRKRKPLTW